MPPPLQWYVCIWIYVLWSDRSCLATPLTIHCPPFEGSESVHYHSGWNAVVTSLSWKPNQCWSDGEIGNVTSSPRNHRYWHSVVWLLPVPQLAEDLRTWPPWSSAMMFWQAWALSSIYLVDLLYLHVHVHVQSWSNNRLNIMQRRTEWDNRIFRWTRFNQFLLSITLSNRGNISQCNPRKLDPQPS